MHVVRENEWVRTWQTSAGQYVDSKYRTYECDASDDAVIIAWQLADDDQREDLETALEFFPYALGIRRIARFVHVISGEVVADRIEGRWFGSSQTMRDETLEFLVEALKAPPEQGMAKQRVCETSWFIANWDGFSYEFLTQGKSQDSPTHADYCREYIKAYSRLHRDVLTRFWGMDRDN